MAQIITELLRRIIAFSVRYLRRLSRSTNRSVGSGAVIDVTRSKKELLAENALSRQQLIILRRGQKRPVLSDWDRIRLVCLARLTPDRRQKLHIVQPDTLLRWHRDLFRMVWRWKSQRRRRKPRIPQETFDLIRQMAADNLTWADVTLSGSALMVAGHR